MKNLFGSSNKPSAGTKSKQSYSKHQLIAFVLVFAAIGAYFLVRSFAATPPAAPAVWLSPASSSLALNSTFTVEVRENSGTTPVNAVQANFSYPATLVDFVSISTSSTAFGLEAQSFGGNGQVTMARGTCGGCAAVTGDQLIATVTFKTKSTNGTAAMAFTSGTALISSSSNTDILGSLSKTYGGNYVVGTSSPTVTLSASPASINAGSTSTLSWTSANATSCTAFGGWSGTKATSGSEAVGPLDQTTVFSLTCTGTGGSATGTATVTVVQVSAGNLSGKVTDAVSGLAVQGVSVSFKVGHKSYSAKTAADGSYSISSIPSGSYSARYSVKKYATQSVSVSISGGQTTTQNVILSPR